MTKNPCHLEARWNPEAAGEGRLAILLTNLTAETLRDFRLAYTSLTRVDEDTKCENAILMSRCANLHEFAPPEGFELKPGETWRFSVGGLSRPARHRTDGISSAYIVFADETAVDITVGPFLPNDQTPTFAPELVPEGHLDLPVAILPWPEQVTASDFAAAPVALFPVATTGVDKLSAMSEVINLAKRLFPASPAPFSLNEVKGGLPLSFRSASNLETEAYGLEFSAQGVTITSSEQAGTIYALITLAQMLHSAHEEPEKFRFPQSGEIVDSPRYQWRGCHLDVSRQVYSLSSVSRFIDILSWNKLNVLHWHLSDDEGWRLEIKAYPELTEIGAHCGPYEKLKPQLGSGAKISGGFYTQDEVRQLVAGAKRLNVDIMPEIDIPGHCTAVLHALPNLVDGQEAPESYHSVQGYANNSINPGLPQTYEFLDKVFSEIAELFPFPYVHVGGDEVADGAWLASPKARELMESEALSSTAELQAHLLRHVKTMLTGMGKKMAGWDEVSHGGGVEPNDTLLMAWQNAELGPELAQMGYEVVMTPGQAYYLDMVQSQDWQEPGLNWAAREVPPKLTYEFEAVADFPQGLAGKLKGIQGCIWSENLVSRELFNHMVFPRLSAIAEAAWTPKQQKSWLRFAAICNTMPRL